MINVIIGYELVVGGCVVRRYAWDKASAARHAADKRDNAHGSYIASVRPIVVSGPFAD